MTLFGQKCPIFAKTTIFLIENLYERRPYRPYFEPKMAKNGHFCRKSLWKKYQKFLFIFYLLILFLGWGKSGLRLGFTVLFWGIKVNCLLRNQ